MAQIYGCQMRVTINFDILANSKEEAQDWINTHSIEDIKQFTSDYSAEHDDQVLEELAPKPFEDYYGSFVGVDITNKAKLQEERTSTMDKIFYSVEQWSDGKMIHVFGEVCHFDDGKEKDYKLAQFTDVYLEIEDIQESGGKFMEYIYNNGGCVCEKEVAKAEAENYSKSFFNGNAKEFDIYECDQDTPCGDYWCEI